MVEGISKEILDMLSYRSAPGQGLKQISLREPPLDLVLDDIAKYHSSYIDVLVQENLIGSRFKSEDSILRKYEKTLLTGGGFKQCFNDVLGFWLRFEEYPDKFPDYFRVVDLRQGKRIDDGFPAFEYLPFYIFPSVLSPAEVSFGKHNIPQFLPYSYCFFASGRRFYESNNQALSESLPLKLNIVCV